jgi:hypothetical protein
VLLGAGWPRLAKRRPRSPEQLGDARAVMVREVRGSPEARRLMRRLASGLPHATLTREARAALGRHERRR